MSNHIDYQRLGWEQFEDLCTNLWFDEGYEGIKPYGGYREGGRDAVFSPPGSGNPLIFQFKRWTGTYSPARALSLIEEAAAKIAHSGPRAFILNSALRPSATVNDGIGEIATKLGFEIQYYDRTWLDLRLDNRRQDLRRRFFGPAVEHLTLTGLLSTTRDQVGRALASLAETYAPGLYVQRSAEDAVPQFEAGDKTVLAIVDRSGCGKTNLLCSMAQSLVNNGKPAILLAADLSADDDHSLERELSTALGFAPGEFPRAVEELARVASENGTTAYVLIDGISEAENLPAVARALGNLVRSLVVRDSVKIVVCCRDISWPMVEHRIPKQFLFATKPLSGDRERDKLAHILSVGDYSDGELDSAIAKYATVFKIEFNPRGDARNRLRHPLLLRLFCEVNQDKTLGDVESVPLGDTYSRYVALKCEATSLRTNMQISPAQARSAVIAVVAKSWDAGLASSVEVEGIIPILQPSTSPERARDLFRLLAQEGLLVIREHVTAGRLSVGVVFEDLRDFLLLEYLLSTLPDGVRREGPIELDIDAIGQHITHQPREREAVKLAELMGMVLTSLEARQGFLAGLSAWDFHGFCLCLSRIPPAGWLAECGESETAQMATTLADCFEWITADHFPDMRPVIDPWFTAWAGAELSRVGIQLEVSPNCREFMYHYRTDREGERSVERLFVDRYPLLSISLSDGTTTIELHDPDHGIALTVVRSSGFNENTKRILNPRVGLPFPGASLDVPERIALFVVWGEVDHAMSSDRLPSEPTYLVEERARALASDLPELGGVTGLTRERLAQVGRAMLSRLPAPSRERTMAETTLLTLDALLARLALPVPESDLPGPDKSMEEIRGPVGPDRYSEGRLREYIGTVFATAIGCYRGVVRVCFPRVASLLNLWAQYPFEVLIFTDGRTVRYAVLPEESEDKSHVRFAIPENESVDLDSPTLSLTVDGLPLDEYVQRSLSRLGRRNPVINPIHRSIPIDQLFTKQPVNDLVSAWVKADLRRMMAI